MDNIAKPSQALHMTRRSVNGRLDGFDIVHTGKHRCKSFEYHWVDAGIEQGWATLTEKTLTLRTYPEPLEFKLLPVIVGDLYVGVLPEDVHERYRLNPQGR